MKFIHINNTKIKTPKKFNIVSLFSGAGGMDLGFLGGFKFLNHYYYKNPFKIIFANDSYKPAVITYNHNIKPRNPSKIGCTWANIKDINLKNNIPNQPIDIVLGGFPCQPFSLAGKRKGLDDKRGQLYKQMIRVIDFCHPKMFVAENVDGIRSLRNKSKTSALDIIIKDFKKHGYNTQYHLLNSTDFGVPQIRKRIIIIGIRKDLPQSIYYPAPKLNQNNWVSAKQGIDDLWFKFNHKYPKQNDNSHVSHAKFYLHKNLQGNNQIKADYPAPTIRANHHGNIEAHYRSSQKFINLKKNNPNGWRRLDIRECARLQSFPDNFDFNTSTSSAYVVIGNAVPPVMAWYIARSVLDTLKALA